MTPRPFAIVRLTSLLIVPIGAFVVAAPKTGLACDWATFAAWSSTWHGPNALETPLRQYSIPRYPGQCDRAAYTGGYEYIDSNGNAIIVQESVNHPAPCPTPDPVAACTGCLPVRSERLGQIPNDLESETSIVANGPGR
jgi:hypothetical protein